MGAEIFIAGQYLLTLAVKSKQNINLIDLATVIYVIVSVVRIQVFGLLECLNKPNICLIWLKANNMLLGKDIFNCGLAFGLSVFMTWIGRNE